MNKPVAMITGAGRGIGRSISHRLAEMGYSLILAARSLEQLEQTAHECREHGASTLSYKVDVAEEKQVLRLFEKAEEKYSRLDVLVNNAGIGVFKPLVNTQLHEWNNVLAVNLTGAFLCSREAFKVMQKKAGGTIINISSVVGIKGYPEQGAYTASKHGLNGLTKVIAEEGRAHNIKAHVICPGGVDTELVKKSRPHLEQAGLIQPDNVADLVEYLLKLPPQVTVDLVHLRRFASSSF
ncbi:SDR family NAD(P)-dependent oxidoreductase [Lentisphaerota bacterium ZTH]|nr:SDR family oxidoreductase [Lentisphaerota bacterium]WET07626.1 SDR family NAD(P)-dependent oxidoreductase [Lentisphaerota bacterium ZTH]